MSESPETGSNNRLHKSNEWLRTNTFQVHCIAFTTMIVSSLLLYPTTQAGATWATWTLSGFFILANLLELATQ